YPQGDDAAESGRRCMGVGHPFLDGPGTPAFRGNSRAQRKGGVLMPGDEPVRPWSLLKKRCSIGKRSPTQEAPRNPGESWVVRQMGNVRMPEQMPRSRAAPGNTRKAGYEAITFSRLDHRRVDLETVLADTLAHGVSWDALLGSG